MVRQWPIFSSVKSQFINRFLGGDSVLLLVLHLLNANPITAVSKLRQRQLKPNCLWPAILGKESHPMSHGWVDEGNP